MRFFSSPHDARSFSARRGRDDDTRRTVLAALDYRVQRFWNNDVLTDTESVLAVILEALTNPAPYPVALRAGESGI